MLLFHLSVPVYVAKIEDRRQTSRLVKFVMAMNSFNVLSKSRLVKPSFLVRLLSGVLPLGDQQHLKRVRSTGKGMRRLLFFYVKF